MLRWVSIYIYINSIMMVCDADANDHSAYGHVYNDDGDDVDDDYVC